MAVGDEDPRLLVTPKQKNLAVFSYAGQGFAANIGDHTIDEVFAVALEAIKKQLEKEEEDGTEQEGEEVRTEDTEQGSGTAEPVAGDTSTRGIPRKVHGPKKSDVR